MRLAFTFAVVALAAQTQTAGTWETIRDQRGASIQIPAGWSGSIDPSSTRITINGPARERMIVVPHFLARR